MEAIERDLKSVEATYGENMLNLTVVRAYIKRLVENAKVVRSLNANRREILSGLESPWRGKMASSELPIYVRAKLLTAIKARKGWSFLSAEALQPSAQAKESTAATRITT